MIIDKGRNCIGECGILSRRLLCLFQIADEGPHHQLQPSVQCMRPLSGAIVSFHDAATGEGLSRRRSPLLVTVWQGNTIRLYEGLPSGRSLLTKAGPAPPLLICKRSWLCLSTVVTVLQVGTVLYCVTIDGFAPLVALDRISYDLQKGCSTFPSSSEMLILKPSSSEIRRRGICCIIPFKGQEAQEFLICYDDERTSSWQLETLQKKPGTSSQWCSISRTCVQHGEFFLDTQQQKEFHMDPFSEGLEHTDLPVPVLQCFQADSQSMPCLGEETESGHRVVLAGLPDGRVLKWPLVGASFLSKDSVHLVWHLEQPVVGIFLNQLGERHNGENYVVIIGQYGKVVVLSGRNLSCQQQRILCIHHPIHSCYPYNTGWFFVVGDDWVLWHASLSLDACGEIRISSCCYSVQNVISVSVPKNSDNDHRDSVKAQVIISKDDSVLFHEVTASTKGHQSASDLQLHDLVGHVQQCSESMQAACHETTKQMDVLKELKILAGFLHGKFGTESMLLCKPSTSAYQSKLQAEINIPKKCSLQQDWWCGMLLARRENTWVSKTFPLDVASRSYHSLHLPTTIATWVGHVEFGLTLSVPHPKYKSVLHVNVARIPLDILDFMEPLMGHAEYRRKSHCQLLQEFSAAAQRNKNVGLGDNRLEESHQVMLTISRELAEDLCKKSQLLIPHLSSDSLVSKSVACFGWPISLVVDSCSDATFVQWMARSTSLTVLYSLRGSVVQTVLKQQQQQDLVLPCHVLISKDALHLVQEVKHRLLQGGKKGNYEYGSVCSLATAEILQSYLDIRNKLLTTFPLV